MARPRGSFAPVMGNRSGARCIEVGEVEEQRGTLDIDAMINGAIRTKRTSEVEEYPFQEAAPEGQPAPVEYPAAPSQDQAPAANTESPAEQSQPLAQPEQPEQAPQEKTPSDPLSQKWETMTPEQRLESWVHAQRMIGKHGEETGVLRKFAEKVMSGQIAVPQPNHQPQNNVVNEVKHGLDFGNKDELVTKFLTDPNEVIEAIINKSVQAVQQNSVKQAINAKLTEVQTRLQQDPNFAQWFDTIPQWIKSAANTPETIDDIIRSYQPQSAPTQQAQAPARRTAPSAMGNGAAPSAAQHPKTTGMVYSQSEITDMMIHRPAEYAAKQAEIWRAYQENRVKR